MPIEFSPGDEPPLTWLDKQYPYPVDYESYNTSLRDYVDALLRASESARNIARGKYWEGYKNLWFITSWKPETGYWKVGSSLRYTVRQECLDATRQSAHNRAWDLGSQSTVTMRIVEIPDATASATILMMEQDCRRNLLKYMCSVDYASFANTMNPDGPYLEDLQVFIRQGYEALMRGQMHYADGITDCPTRPTRRERRRKQ